MDPIDISSNAIDNLVEWCRAQRYSRVAVVCDERTCTVAGRQITESLQKAGITARTIIVAGEEVIADEVFLVDAFVQAHEDDELFISAGSGTITDITRFVSHRMRRSFVSVPTAASVDGFTSKGSPLVLRGVKLSIYTHAPTALFCDPAILAGAPPELAAAGYGDLIAKIISVADWRVGRIIWDEPYDEEIARRTLEAAHRGIDNRAEIGKRTPEALTVLLEALIESGFCMLDFGNSRPASGAEHHLSHFWEMELLQRGKPAILHGAKVGVATVFIASLFERIRSLDRDAVVHRLRERSVPSFEEECATIHSAYGPLADSVIEGQRSMINMSQDQVSAIEERIVDRWEEIREVAREVPTSDEFIEYLRAVGAPTTTDEIGLSAETAQAGKMHGHYLRERFTSVKLLRFLGMSVIA